MNLIIQLVRMVWIQPYTILIKMESKKFHTDKNKEEQNLEIEFI